MAKPRKPQGDFSDVLASVGNDPVPQQDSASPPPPEVPEATVLSVDQALKEKAAKAIGLLINQVIAFAKPSKTRRAPEVLALAQDLINKARIIANKLKGE